MTALWRLSSFLIFSLETSNETSMVDCARGAAMAPDTGIRVGLHGVLYISTVRNREVRHSKNRLERG